MNWCFWGRSLTAGKGRAAANGIYPACRLPGKRTLFFLLAGLLRVIWSFPASAEENEQLSGGELPGINGELLWRRAIGGEIDAFPAQGPSGNVYVVADDRALHSIDPLSGESHWVYRPGGRLKNMLLVAPDGTIYVQNDRQELYAVTPGGTGRWKLSMNRNSAALPASAPDGRLIVPLQNGRILGISRHGRILWTVDEGAEVSAAPVVTSDGTAWVPLSDGRILSIDFTGNSRTGVSIGGGPVSTLSLDGLGRVWAGTFDGRVLVYAPDPDGSLKEAFSLRPHSSRVVSILTGAQGEGMIFTAGGVLLETDAQGAEILRRQLMLSGGSPSAAFDGTLYIPAADGSIQVLAPGGSVSALRGGAYLAEPLLSAEGVLIAGGGDWVLYGWKAPLPGPGWRQFRGDSRRAGTFPSEPRTYERKEARRDPAFFLRETMALSDDLSVRLSLLEELESFPDSFSMRRKYPWVDLILEDLASVGTIRRVDVHNQPLQSHPLARARSYRLIAQSEDYRSRRLLLAALAFEDDSAALAAGFRALGYTGADWDGASTRLMSSRFCQLSEPGEQLTLECARALADLIRYNGTITDPAGYELMKNLLQVPLSAHAREEVLSVVRLAAAL